MNHSPEPASPLHTSDLSKKFGSNFALAEVNLTAPVASVCGLVGANGAGKSTLLSCVVGLTLPSSGNGWVFGQPFGSDAAKRLVSFAPDELPLPSMLTGLEFLQLVDDLERREAYSLDRAKTLARTFGIEHALTKLIGAYSHGMKRRLQFCAAFSSDALLLILDEPFSGLDVEGSVLLRMALRTWTDSGRTALVTIHDLHTAERECDFVMVLSAGRAVAQGAPADIVAQAGSADLETAVLHLSGIEPSTDHSRREFDDAITRLGEPAR